MAAASTNLLLKEVEDITECPICTDRFCNPKMLPCCHMFCLKCIERYGEDKKEGDTMPCPMCRREFKVPTGGFSELKTNFFIDKLISVQSVSSANTKNSDADCDVCTTAGRNGKMNAVSFCMTCRESLCDECCNNHKSMKITKGHKLSPVSEVSEVMRKKLEESFCKKHPTKELEFYCQVCKVPSCATCSITNHNSHKICEIGETAETFKKDFLEYSDNVCEIMRSIEERSDKANEQVESFTRTIETLKSGIIERGDNIKGMVDRQTAELLEDLNFHKFSILEKIETDKEGLRMSMMICDNFKQFCTKVVTEADSVEVVRVADEVKTRAEEVKLLSLPELKTLPRIKFVPLDLDITTNHQNIVGRFSHEEATGGYVKVPKDRRPVRSPHEKVSEKQKFDSMMDSVERRSIESTKRELQNLSQTAEKEAVLDNSLIKKAVAKISEDQKRKFKDLEKLHSIKIAYGAEGIRLIGDRDETSKAMPKVYEIIMSAMRSKKETRELELFAKNAIWRYQEKDKMVEFGEYATGTIERAHHDKKKVVEWTSKKDQIKHRVDVKAMIDDRQPGGPTKVMRSVPGSTGIPYRWEQMSPDKIYIRVDVKSGTEEYNKVLQNLTSTAQNMLQAVIKVERIQNPGLYRQYMNRKQFMDEFNKSAGIKDNEKRLWHGTGPTNIENINSRNFNRSYSGVHGLAIGYGAYFATTSAYSIRGYCQADAAGNKYIYQARVLTGQTTKGVGGLKEAPPLPGRTDATYDSVCDNPAAPGMFVVFYEYQMYPEYLITFK